MPSVIHMRISSGDCTESFQRHFSSTEVEVISPIGRSPMAPRMRLPSRPADQIGITPVRPW